MPLNNVPLPYGLRDIRLTAYTDAAGTTLDTASIDLPYARTLSFTDQEDFEDLEGDDRLITSHGKGASVAWELESGGISYEAFKLMSGGAVTTTGVSPNQIKVFAKKVTDARPYFKIEGQAVSDSGGDVHCVIHRCKATGDLSGEFKNGSFFLTAAEGTGFPSLVTATLDELYRFTQNETLTAIS